MVDNSPAPSSKTMPSVSSRRNRPAIYRQGIILYGRATDDTDQRMELDQAVIAVTDIRSPWHVSRRGTRQLGPVLLISLWLHLSLLLSLLVTFRYERHEEELPPPATVAMVFDGGSPQGPALPNSRPDVVAPTQQPPPAPVPQVQAVPSPPALPPQPEPPPAPAPDVALAPPPPAPQTAPIPEPLPVPPLPPSAAVPSEIPPPRPPPAVAMVVPPPRPVPSTPRPVPQPAPSTAPSTAPSRPGAFPAPMNFSFDRPTPRSRTPNQATSRAGPLTLDFSLAPRNGASDNSPFSQLAGLKVGPDWRNELSAWVRAHAYYPQQAAMNGEDGDVMVRGHRESERARDLGRAAGRGRARSGSTWRWWHCSGTRTCRRCTTRRSRSVSTSPCTTS